MNDLQVANVGGEKECGRAGSNGNRFGSQSGQAMVLGTLTLSILFGAVGLSTDLGFNYFKKLQLQTAADAAASAAAIWAYNGGVNSDKCSTSGGSVSCGVPYTCAGVTPATNALQAGCLYATADAPAGATVTMIESGTPPAGHSTNTPGMWIQTTVTASNHNLFLYWGGFQTASVLGQAVGGFSTISPGGCVYALSTTAAVGVAVNGSSSIATSGCGVNIASSSSTALTVTGSSHVTANNGGQIVLNCATCYSITGSSYATPTPYVVGSVTDPLSSLPAPTFSGCTHSLAQTTPENNYSLGNSNTATRGPGVYCGGISVGGSATLTLNPGTYIMDGGGFNISNSGKVIATGGVFIYNTATSGHTAGSVSIQGSAVVNLVAPTSGTYQGIAFFQDRHLSNAATIANSGTGNITGTYYFYDAAFNFDGSSQAATTAAFVANTISVTGSSSLTNDSTGKLTGLSKTSIAVMQ